MVATLLLILIPSIFSPAEYVTKLRVGIFVKTARGRHAEVSPDIFVGLEVELVDGAGAGLEALVGVLRGDPGSYHVSGRLGARPAWVSEIYGVSGACRRSKEFSDGLDPVGEQVWYY